MLSTVVRSTHARMRTFGVVVNHSPKHARKDAYFQWISSASSTVPLCARTRTLIGVFNRSPKHARKDAYFRACRHRTPRYACKDAYFRWVSLTVLRITHARMHTFSGCRQPYSEARTQGCVLSVDKLRVINRTPKHARKDAYFQWINFVSSTVLRSAHARMRTFSG